MLINLNDKFRINQNDSQNIALEKLSLNGKRWKGTAFFGTIKSALLYALDAPEIAIEHTTLKECKDWLEMLRNVTQQINATL